VEARPENSSTLKAQVTADAPALLKVSVTWVGAAPMWALSSATPMVELVEGRETSRV